MNTIPFLSETKCCCEISACGMTLNFSRQRLNNDQWESLLDLAKERNLISAQIEMMNGVVVNKTESRQVLHTSLRSKNPNSPFYAEIQEELSRMKQLAKSVRDGSWKGVSGKRITDVINIGIGGSEMGPHAVYHALREVTPKVRLHFLSAVDGVLLDRVLGDINPETTLVIISSKSFSTQETMINAEAVSYWFNQAGISSCEDRAKHFFVVSSKQDAFKLVNVPSNNQFHIWDWVGGRFSVWSAVGLPVLIALGESVFQEFLDGAYEMDKHLCLAPIEENLPITLALLSYYSHTELNLHSHCLLPYDERLRLLVPWLQQLEMESLGKARSIENELIHGMTGQAVWGGMGNEAQHSFYQWIREGVGRTNIGILWCKEPGHSHKHHHRVLVANAKAQAEALIKVERKNCVNAISTLVLDELTPKTLGTLMALYEHKTAILGTLYGINAFDQPGVELGKKLSRQFEEVGWV